MGKRMLKLKSGTDPQWVSLVEKDLEQILTDHAFAEQKAALTAMSIINQFPEFTDVVNKMADLVIEEMEHFRDVMGYIEKLGYSLGRDSKDPYVADLQKFFTKGGRTRVQMLVDKLLFAAMIEARSCERFRVLSEHIDDEELRGFYKRLMKSEAGHYSMFLLLAKKHGGAEAVEKKWKDFLKFEAGVIAKYGKTSRIHG